MNESEERKQTLTVALKDVARRSLVLYQDVVPRRPVGSRVFDASQIADSVVERFFDQHYQAYTDTSPNEFIIYFKSDECPPSSKTARLTIPGVTVERSIMGSEDEPYVETLPYCIETSMPEPVTDPDEFPTIIEKFLGIRPPGVDPVVEFVRKMDERKKHK